MARSTSLALQPPMPVSRSGVMFAPLTLYSDVSQLCGPPACSRAVSSAPPCTRGVWQLRQVRIPSTRYLPRSSGVSAAATPPAMLNAAIKNIPPLISPPPALIFGPPYRPHEEMSASGTGPLSCVLCRSGQEPVVVNLDIPLVEKPEEVHWVDNIHPAPKP